MIHDCWRLKTILSHKVGLSYADLERKHIARICKADHDLLQLAFLTGTQHINQDMAALCRARIIHFHQIVHVTIIRYLLVISIVQENGEDDVKEQRWSTLSCFIPFLI